jgi:hypothetical protein
MGSTGWRFLDGKKTILGVIGTVATVVISAGGQPAEIASKGVEIVSHLDTLLTGGFMLLTAVGILHKRDKAR